MFFRRVTILTMETKDIKNLFTGQDIVIVDCDICCEYDEINFTKTAIPFLDEPFEVKWTCRNCQVVNKIKLQAYVKVRVEKCS
jgi:hypothetical protein